VAPDGGATPGRSLDGTAGRGVPRCLDFATEHRLYPLFHLIAYRRLRRGEAVGLRWEDIDLDAGLFRVSQQIVQLGWATEVGDPKSDSGARTVNLDAGTIGVLRLWRAQQDDERRTWGGAWRHTGLVFTREDGSALHPDMATRSFERLYRAAGLPPIRLHDLRHTAASLALQAGVPLKVVSEQLGHSMQVTTGGPPGDRTRNLRIKSPLLCQLS